MKNKAVFLDKDGTIIDFIYEPEGKIMSCTSIDQVKILPGVKEGIQKLKELGYKVIVISNQPGVAFGYLSKERLKEIDSFLKKELGLDEVYSCIHHPNYTGNCDCRKPLTGLINKASDDFEIDVGNSFVVGDNLSDIEMGKNSKVKKTFRLGSPRADIIELQHKKNIFPDFTSRSILEIARKIESLERKRNIDRLELGSGEKPSEGYLHQDITNLEGVDLDYVCNPWEIPLEENSLSEVIALGVMEHIRYEEFRKIISHMKKILKKGGSFLFDVPDMKIWSEYLYNTTHGMSDRNPFPDNHVWATIYGWQRWPGDEHKCGWTKKMLFDELEKYGFSNIEEGVDIFLKKGIQRGRFTRPGDAHIYIKLTK